MIVLNCVLIWVLSNIDKYIWTTCLWTCIQLTIFTNPVQQNGVTSKKSPKKGAELANHNLWSEACRRAAQILQAAQPDGPTEQQLFERRISQIPDYYTLDEARTLLEEFRRRYEAQLPNTRGKHPDAQAPIDPKTGKGKQYAQFPAFIRAMLYHQLRTQ